MKNYLDVILVVSSLFFLGRTYFEVYTYSCNLDGCFFSFYSDAHVCINLLFFRSCFANQHAWSYYAYTIPLVYNSRFSPTSVF